MERRRHDHQPARQHAMLETGLNLVDVFCGSAAFLGEGSHGEDADVPDHLSRLAEELFDTKPAA
jgi:hypothetical protein